MEIRHTRIRKLVLVVLLFSTTNVVGQNYAKHTIRQPKTNECHCHRIDDIWKFAKPNNKRHAVLTIMGLNVNDTLSMKIDGEIVVDSHVYSGEDSLRLADINGRLDECFFLVYYRKNLLRTIYNSRDCSEYTIFEREQSRNSSCEVEILFNGELYRFHFQLTDRWHIIIVGRDTRKVSYYSKEYFRGIE